MTSTAEISKNEDDENGGIRQKKIHPLKMPRRTAPSGNPICRFYNYDKKKGCVKGDNCPLDHKHCHICISLDHIASDCPVYKDDSQFAHFTSTYTLKNTRPENHPKKTVLGDVVIWDSENKLPRECWGDDDGQLKRCKKHKRLEAELLWELGPNSSFLDVGAHLGDTVITMAIHARVIGREDIRFYAFEPSRIKCQWITSVAEDNGLAIKVINAAVGDTQRLVIPEKKKKSRAVFDGSLKYDVVGNEEMEGGGDDVSGNHMDSSCPVQMICLDSIPEMHPLGLLHLDVEGWESDVIRGASNLLEKTLSPCFVIAEVWDDKDCKRRGVGGGAEEKIEAVMHSYTSFERKEDILDLERNAVYVKR